MNLRDKYGKLEIVEITEKGYNHLNNNELINEPSLVQELDERREKLANYKPLWIRINELLEAGIIPQETVESLKSYQLDPIDIVNLMATTPTNIHDVTELTENDIVETNLNKKEIDEIYRIANLDS
ncbi:hypothetical protein [Methanohalobium sp.]|uniref:hypothetical protein n=1 Tax=Methanohalobium sp. TaxID=2837493 RepID=UPI0025D5BF4D|nr:hypothetical protein [Methanohalobium sp.]